LSYQSSTLLSGTSFQCVLPPLPRQTTLQIETAATLDLITKNHFREPGAVSAHRSANLCRERGENLYAPAGASF
jgi:hypothetical protein